jgi:hypothetical protein
VLRRAFADPAVQTVDWMTSVAPETLLAANASQGVVRLRRRPRDGRRAGRAAAQTATKSH